MSKTQRLIKMVRQYPVLYDISHEDNKNARKKYKIWQEIGKEINVSGEEAKKKWKNLRDTYGKYIRSTKSKPGKSKKGNRIWLWADQMEPFRPYLSFTKNSSNIRDSVDSAENTVLEGLKLETGMEVDENFENQIALSEHFGNDALAEAADTESLHASRDDPLAVIEIRKSLPTESTLVPESDDTPKTEDSARHKQDRKRSATLSSIGEVIDYFENKKNTTYDAIDCLFLAHAKTIKTFSGKRQAIAKMKIAQVIMDQELLHLEDASATNPLPTPESAT